EVLAVLEVELLLPALLGGTGERVAVGRRVAEDGSTELLVHEDAGLVLGDASGDGGPEAVVDHLLGDGDLRRLLGAQRALPAEHLRLERPTVVEGQDIPRMVEAHNCHLPFLSFRLRRIMLFVELSWPRIGSVSLSSSWMIPWASALPSSTPH